MCHWPSAGCICLGGIAQVSKMVSYEIGGNVGYVYLEGPSAGNLAVHLLSIYNVFTATAAGG